MGYSDTVGRQDDKIIIGLTGPAGVGKTTLAAELASMTTIGKVSFANGVYAVAEILSGCSKHRLQDKTTPFCTGETVELLVGKTPRWLLRMIGTEMVRDCIHPDMWVAMALREVQAMPEKIIVIDDCRFPNEVAVVDLLVKLSRAGVQYSNDHVTETELPGGLSLDLTGLSVATAAATVAALARALLQAKKARGF